MFNTDGTPRNPNIRAANPDDTSYGANDTFTKLVNGLKLSYGLDYSVSFFPYDWRKTNTEARLLYEYINNEKYDEVIIVAHSMGGIVSALSINNHGNTVNGVTKIGNAKLDKLRTHIQRLTTLSRCGII